MTYGEGILAWRSGCVCEVGQHHDLCLASRLNAYYYFEERSLDFQDNKRL